MSNILRVTTPLPGYESNNIKNNTQNPAEKTQIQNPVDPSRVVRPDGRTDANSQREAQLGMSYESNFGTFVQLLRDTPPLSDTMSKLMCIRPLSGAVFCTYARSPDQRSHGGAKGRHSRVSEAVYGYVFRQAFDGKHEEHPG